MINFIVFKKDTGQIIRTGTTTSENQIAIQAINDDTFDVVITEDISVKPDTHYINEGIAVLIPQRTSNNLTFDYVQKLWIDRRSDQELKDAQWEMIKAQRDIGEMAPFNYKNYVLDGDLNAQRRLMVLISISKSAIAAGQSFSNDFTLADNSVVNFTAEDFIAIEMAKAIAVTNVFAKARTLRERIDNATREEIPTINW